MAHLSSKHTLNISLSNGTLTTDFTATQMQAIQGPTDVTFDFSQVELGPIGLYDLSINFGDGTPIYTQEPTFDTATRAPSSLSSTSTTHTYYQTTTGVSVLTATLVARYLSGGDKPLSALHNVVIKQTAENILDKNFNVLNNQLFTLSGEPTPYFNLESDENIIFPCSFVEIASAVPAFDDSIYLNTDPEPNIDTSQTYLYRTLINFDSDIAGGNLSALSGSGFTLQGKSGKLFTVAFSVSGEPLRYSYTTTPTSLLLTKNIDELTVESLQAEILSLFSDVSANEFSNIVSGTSSVEFYQSNLLPPEATNFVYATSTSATSSFNGLDAFNASDNTYSYITNSFGPSGVTGLSAVNRMKTDPNSLLVRAL